MFFSLFGININAQNCSSLYLSNAANGNVYDISALNGTLPATFTTLNTAANSNLAVGPNPSNTTQTVFTSSDVASGSPVYVSNSSIGTNLPAEVGGLTANPSGGTVYGVTANKNLVKASPAPATNLGAITGDATWNGGTVSSGAFFDTTGNMYVILTSGSLKYIYKINTATRVATQYLGLSGTLPNNVQGLAFHNGNIYAVEGGTTGIIIVFSVARVYEINANTGVSTLKTTYTLAIGLIFSATDDLDLASCQAFTPPSAPTCNELFGSVSAANSATTIYRINTSTLATTSVGSIPSNTLALGNLAYGPTAGNLSQNQFVASANNRRSNIFTGAATSGNTILTATTNFWGAADNSDAPPGLGTDPSTGVVWGIVGKILTKWTGTGDYVNVGTITGDANWTSGTTLNDVAVDNGGNLYCIISNGASNVWLYRINTTTLVASPVVKVSGTYPTDLNTTNGNGLAYLGDGFYYSRISGANTDIWKLNAMTGASVSVGTVSSRTFGDLASCATVTNVPATFNFNCGGSGAGLQNGPLIANGTTQTNTLRVPILNAVNGLAEFTFTGTGISTSPSPYTVFVAQGATYVDIPFTYDGSSPTGARTITVTSPRGTGSCSITINIDGDADGDGVANSIDLDDDNDGILDSLECPGTASFTNGGLEGSAAIATDPTGWNRVTYDEAYNEATVSGQDTVDIITSTGPAAGIGLAGNPAEGTSAIHALYGPSISGDFTQEGIKQTITGLLVGKNYTVKFKQAVVKSLNYTDNTGRWKVFIDGILKYDSEPTTSTLVYTDTNLSWESRSFTFTATATSHTIAFLSSGLTTTSKVAMGLDDIKFDSSCDFDNDGIPNSFDLDSDNDGCADALEGDENVIASQLTSNRISGTVDANGVPNLVNAGGASDIGSDQGQGIGEAYNAAIQSGCFCYKPAQTTGTALDTNHGITALGRAGDDNSNWPMVRKGAWTVLEAKTKGFVVNRLTDTQIAAIPSADLREGMMVYNITQDCLQINIDGTATGWKCFNNQTCPD